MRLVFEQRAFSWFDSYDIYDEWGNPAFHVAGQLAWGHKLHIYDAGGNHVGTVREVVFSFPRRFELYRGDAYMGCIRKELSLFRPRFYMDFNGWQVAGDFMGWDYTIVDGAGQLTAHISKELLHFTDTYTIDVCRPEDALNALMVVLAIDADKCSSQSEC